jgi:hypothetical protein
MTTQANRENEDLSAYELSYEEGWKLLDAEARRSLGMSGEEFMRRWDAGEVDFDDPETHGAVVRLWMLLPFVREERAD